MAAGRPAIPAAGPESAPAAAPPALPASPVGPSSAERPVVLAAIAGAHGVHGEVRLKLFTESLARLAQKGPLHAGGRTLALQKLRPGPQGAIATFAGIASRGEAEALRGALLTIDRALLPEPEKGALYWHDLVGRAVVTPDGARAGTVASVQNYGASDLLEVRKEDGKLVLVPLIDEAVPAMGASITIRAEWL